MVNLSYPNRHIKLCSRMSSKIKDQEEVNDFSLDLDMAALSLKSRKKMSEDFDFNSNLIVTGPGSCKATTDRSVRLRADV